MIYAHTFSAAVLTSVALAACADVAPANSGTDEPASAEAALTVRADSVYTSLDDRSCKLVDSGEAFTISDCGGVGTHRFILEQDDLRYSAKITSRATQSELDLWAGSLQSWPAPKPAGGFQDVGPKVEWRVPTTARTSPYAAIFRLTENDGRDQLLVVAKVTSNEACLFAIVDGRAPNANELARTKADAARTASCPKR